MIKERGQVNRVQGALLGWVTGLIDENWFEQNQFNSETIQKLKYKKLFQIEGIIKTNQYIVIDLRPIQLKDCKIQILFIISKNLCAQMSACFNMSIPFYSDSDVPARSHYFRITGSQTLGFSVITPPSEMIYSALCKWILCGFC